MEFEPQHQLQDAQALIADRLAVGEQSFSKIQDELLEDIRRLKSEVETKTSECEFLKIRCDVQDSDIQTLNQELNRYRLTESENSQLFDKTQEEIVKNKKIEDDYAKLMIKHLESIKDAEECKRKLMDYIMVKANAVNNYECLMSGEAIEMDLNKCKSELDDKTNELNLALAKIRNIEEENATKERCISEFRKTLDDVKVTYKHEVNVLQEYIQSLKNTVSSYEKMLASYMEELTPQTAKTDSTNSTNDDSLSREGGGGSSGVNQ